MALYLRQSGLHTTQNDSERLVWYSARCTYWTDDWTMLGKAGQSEIPCCPVCGSVGLQIVFRQYDEGARKYDSDPNQVGKGYYAFVQSLKEKCAGNAKEAFERFKHTQGVEQLNSAISLIMNSKISDN